MGRALSVLLCLDGLLAPTLPGDALSAPGIGPVPAQTCCPARLALAVALLLHPLFLF